MLVLVPVRAVISININLLPIFPVAIPSIPQVLVRCQQLRVRPNHFLAERDQNTSKSDGPDADEAEGEDLHHVFVLLFFAENQEDGQQQDQRRQKRMQTGVQEELDEVLDIAFANTGADPGTVVVMDLHAELAGAAVERSRRTEEVACLAVAQLVMLVIRK